MNYKIIQIDEQTWRIEEDHVRFFLLTGSQKALLIDSGMNVTTAKEIAESITSLPIELLNTHADMDHIASNDEFEYVYMNPAECSNYYKMQKNKGKIKPVWDQDIIDLGNRPLKVIAIPGHTPGSIALLDVNKKVLFSGDPIQDGKIFMFGVQREFHAYQHSLLKLNEYLAEFQLIYPSHGSFPVQPSLIMELYQGVEKIMNGEIMAKDVSFHHIPLKEYDIGVATFLCDIDYTQG